MAVFTCKVCGNKIEYTSGASVVRCSHCSVDQSVPSDGGEFFALYEKANSLRRDKNFDAAAKLYKNIAKKAPKEAEAYWGMALCRFGVGYSDENGKRKLEVSLARETLFSDDENYKSALKYADEASKVMYSAAAKLIEETAEPQRLENVYNSACEIMKRAKSAKRHEFAAELFDNIAFYRDSGLLAGKCRKEACECKAKSEARTAFFVKTVAPSLLICFILIFTVNFYNYKVKPMLKFKSAIDLVDAGKCEEAREVLAELADYKDIYKVEAASYAKEGNYEKAYETVLVSGVDFEEYPIAGAYEAMVHGDFGEGAKLGLDEVILPDGLVAIDNTEFLNCEYLSRAELPDSIEIIGDYAFWFTSRLENVTLPSGLKIIGDAAFGGSGLREIVIPEGTVEIGKYAFRGCVELKSVTLPKSIEYIGDDAFGACHALENVYFSGTVSDWERLNCHFEKEIIITCTDGTVQNTV